jgi:hypothetical protein
MSEQDENDVRQLLQDVFPPVNADLTRDLWPLMLRKLDARKPPVAWYDWALVGLVGSVIIVFPNLILVLIYHL